MADTKASLFRAGVALTTPAGGEPCLVLVRNDQVMNLLISDDANVQGARLALNQVLWFCAQRDRTVSRHLLGVQIFQGDDGIWRARDTASGKLIRQPSRIPYHVVFITKQEHQRLTQAIRAGYGAVVFHATQQHFGSLPGYDFGEDVLISPPGYATATVEDAHGFLLEHP